MANNDFSYHASGEYDSIARVKTRRCLGGHHAFCAYDWCECECHDLARATQEAAQREKDEAMRRVQQSWGANMDRAREQLTK